MEILVKPIITEKATGQTDALNVFTFVVNRKANKLQIKDAIEQRYNVAVEAVNTMNYAGKSKTKFTKAGMITGKSSAFKKAIITVAKGEEIDFYSNI